MLQIVNLKNNTKIIKNFALNCLIGFLLFNGLTGQANENEKTVFGRVFYDENKNGIKNDFEKGVSGVKVKLDSTNFAITDEKGDYTLTINTSNQESRISLDDDSFPGGSILTTDETYNFSNQKQFIQQKDFGIFYPKKEIDLSHNVSTQGFFLVLPSKVKTLILFDGNSLRIGGVKRFNTLNSKKSFRKEYINVHINNSKLKIQDFSIKKIEHMFRNGAFAIKKATINIPQNFKPEDDHFVREIELKLIALGMNKENITRIKKGVFSDLRIDFFSKKTSECFIINGSKSSPLIKNETQSFEFKIKAKNDPYAFCGDKKQRLIIPRISFNNIETGITPLASLGKIVKSSENKSFDIKINLNQSFKIFLDNKQLVNNILKLQKEKSIYNLKMIGKQGIEFAYQLMIKESSVLSSSKSLSSADFTISHSNYLNLSRDFAQSFVIKDKQRKRIYINGRYIAPKEDRTTVLLHSKRGLNELDIERANKKYRYQYKIMEEPSIEAKFRIGYYNSNITISEFNTNYTTPRILRTDYFLKVFPTLNFKNDWGIGLRYTQDVEGVETDINSGEKEVQKHKESSVHLLKRFIFNPSILNPIKYSFGLGTFNSTYDNPENAAVFLPEDISGISSEVNILWPSLGSEYLDLSTQIFIGIDTQNTSNYVFNLTGELSYSLNQLGKFFNANSTFSHHYRYNYFQYFKLNLSLSYEKSERSLENASRGRLSENITMIQSGISWHY